MFVFEKPQPKKLTAPSPHLKMAPPQEIFPCVGAWEFLEKMSYREKMDLEKFRALSSKYSFLAKDRAEQSVSFYFSNALLQIGSGT